MRLTRFVFVDDYYQPTNLCKHFWKTMAAILMGVVLGIGFIFVFIALGTGAKRAFNGEDVNPWWVRSKKAPKKHHEPNIFIEWVKAKKNRVCPLIKVVEVIEEHNEW